MMASGHPQDVTMSDTKESVKMMHLKAHTVCSSGMPAKQSGLRNVESAADLKRMHTNDASSSLSSRPKRSAPEHPGESGEDQPPAKTSHTDVQRTRNVAPLKRGKIQLLGASASPQKSQAIDLACEEVLDEDELFTPQPQHTDTDAHTDVPRKASAFGGMVGGMVGAQAPSHTQHTIIVLDDDEEEARRESEENTSPLPAVYSTSSSTSTSTVTSTSAPKHQAGNSAHASETMVHVEEDEEQEEEGVDGGEEGEKRLDSRYCSADRISVYSGSKHRYSAQEGQTLREQATAEAAQDLVGSPMYADQIYEHMRGTEVAFIPQANPQGEVTARMRSILIDWLIEVQVNFSLVQESLYLAVNILNRYIAARPVSRERLQLVGATCLLLASKHEEIYPPEVGDFVYICADTYTREEILAMEIEILRVLDFKLCAPMSWQFLLHFHHVGRGSEHSLFLAKYILELSLQEHVFYFAQPSYLAAAAFDLASRALKEPGWTEQMVSRFSHSTAEVVSYGKMLNRLANARPRDLLNCRRKYSSSRLGRVSTLQLGLLYDNM